ncbi:MAG: hypothetical protein Q8942_02650 [Bacillota bacterium]|nr:hypothetical protein [Bacillota bacterium]
MLKKEGVYLPDTKVKNPNVDNWSYTSVKQLNSLGLISAGANNDYKFDKEATQKDLAALILNGICRLAPEKYSLKLDKRIRPYFTEDGLTIDRAAVILLELNGEAANNKEAYSKACEKGYIDNEMQLRLKDQKIMTMDQVFELSAYNIKLFTGKTFPE